MNPSPINCSFCGETNELSTSLCLKCGMPLLFEHRTTRRRALTLGLTAIGAGWLASCAEVQPTPSPSSTHTLTSPTTLITPSETLPPTPIYRGHSGEVMTVAWSPDGTRLASGSRDNTAKVWDVATGKNILTYTNHTGWVNAVAWSPDGTRIASASADDTVQVWDATAGTPIRTYKGHSSAVLAMAWSPDGKSIASAGYDKTVQVWDAAAGGLIATYKGHSAEVDALVWSPDGKLIASGGGTPPPATKLNTDTTVQVWDAASGSHIFTYAGHYAQVDALAWSPNGTRIASGSYDKSVQVWDVAKQGQTFILTYRGHSNIVRAVAWSPDGFRIASGSADWTAQVWSIDHVFTYRDHSNWVHVIAWSPDGKYIASASADQTIQVWEAKLGV